MEQFANVQQINKKEEGQEKRKPIYPSTVIQAVFDGKTGASLEAILAQFNSIYVQYQGTPKDTRLVIPKEMRRAGLTITYMDMESNTITERANSAVQKDNDHWGLDVNWSRVDELSLSGDISVSAKGTWIINGTDTGVKAVGPKGDTGLTPWLKTIDNKLNFSYDNVTWEPCSENIAAWFRWSGNKIQISRDNKTWTDLSGKFADNVHIKGYVANYASLPSGAVQGDIYGVGPTYAAEDTAHTNPIYRYYVRNANTWVDNGSFTSLSAGVVQETGNSETEVMSQKAVTEKLSELGSETSERLALNLGNDLVFYKNTSSSISSIDDYHALVDNVDYDCLMIKVKEGVDVKVTGAIPAQFVFYSSLPIRKSNSGYIKYNTSGKSVEGAKYCVINFRHSENEGGYDDIEINTDYSTQNVKEKMLWKVVYVELSSRIADEINALPEGAIFLNTYSNNLGIRTGESGWKDHEFAKNELYIIDDRPYCFNGTGLVSLTNKNNGHIDWSDKKWVCVGDSLTEINGRTTKHYFDYISEATGISVINMGVGGTGYKDESMGGDAFYQRVLDIDTSADVITIFGSGNDLSHPLGEITDTGTDTICGCVNKTIDNLFQVFPLANVGIITPTPWGWYPPYLTDNNKMATYSKAIVEICNRRGIPVLDLYHCSGLRPWDKSYLPLCCSKDDENSVHPDENGHKIIASKIQHFVESLLLH